jgi:Asp-tRNA(Asn)/Glu-tRNA(Gln) amidotransferase A subunit family amidase
MPDTELLFMPATQAAARIRTRELSPVEYVDAVLAAAHQAQPRLNAFVTIMDDEARAAARAAEQAVMRGDALGPLHGVPVTVKDEIDVLGVRTTRGSHVYADNVATRDDILVARLKAAGAIVVAKTTLPEFGHKGLTDSPLQGITRNPWDLSRTPGGSSGGAAAAAASGIAPLALGTDGAGSVRIPAACCGLVGLKPTQGIVPWETARDAFGNNISAGPMTRTVADATVMFDVIAGPSPFDPLSQQRKRPRVSTKFIGSRLDGVRIANVPRMTNPRVASDVAANLAATRAVLEGLGAQIEDAGDDIDWLDQPGRIMFWANLHAAFSTLLPQWGNQLSPSLVAMMAWGEKFSLAEFRQAQFARTRLFRDVEALFERFDLLLTPTLTRTALPADFDPSRDEVDIGGFKCGITRQGFSAYVYPFSLTGHPALTVPNGFGADGLPTAVQLVGRYGADLDLFRVATMVEREAPWAARRPPGP